MRTGGGGHFSMRSVENKKSAPPDNGGQNDFPIRSKDMEPVGWQVFIGRTLAQRSFASFPNLSLGKIRKWEF